MEKTNICPTCKMRRNPAHTLCPKCDRGAFIEAVKKGMDPFDNMSVRKIVWAAVLAAAFTFIIPLIASLVVTVEGISSGALVLDASDSSAVDRYVQENYPALMTLSMFAGQLIGVLAVVFCLRKYLGVIAVSFKNYKNILMSAAVIAVVFVLSMLWVNIAEVLFGSVTNENQATVENELLSYPVIGLISTGLLAPLLEELTYRCGVFNLLRRKNILIAYIVSSVVFALIHINFEAASMTTEWISLPGYLLVGVSFCFIYNKFGFAGSFIAHALNNTVASLFILLPAIF